MIMKKSAGLKGKRIWQAAGMVLAQSFRRGKCGAGALRETQRKKLGLKQTELTPRGNLKFTFEA